jgi:hypothetical protein
LKIENWKNFIHERRKAKYADFFDSEQECFQHIAHVAYFGGALIYPQWKKFTDAGDQVSFCNSSSTPGES